MAVKKRKKALATSKAKGSSVSHWFEQYTVGKRKESQLFSLDASVEPAARCPVPRTFSGDGSVLVIAMGKNAAKCSQQLGPTEGGLAYAVVVARHAIPKQPRVWTCLNPPPLMQPSGTCLLTCLSF